MKHTRLPWEHNGLSRNDEWDRAQAIYTKDGKVLICLANGRNGFEAPSEEQDANMRFITVAANFHEELVAMLRRLDLGFAQKVKVDKLLRKIDRAAGA